MTLCMCYKCLYLLYEVIKSLAEINYVSGQINVFIRKTSKNRWATFETSKKRNSFKNFKSDPLG